MEMNTKVCKDCGVEKPLTEFRVIKGKRYEMGFINYHSYCKPCHYIRNRKTDKRYKKTDKYREKYRVRLIESYGITVEEFDAMKEEQGGVCKICGGEANGRGELHIDHCHDTGKVRGLLCSDCNTGLGLFRDNVELMRNAIEYLNT